MEENTQQAFTTWATKFIMSHSISPEIEISGPDYKLFVNKHRINLIGNNTASVLCLCGSAITHEFKFVILAIIINPEAHLHPASQSQIGQFLARVASLGIQIIVESHSDHIFNGVRKSIAKGTIFKKQVSINFFELDEKLLTKNIKIEISDSGRVLNHINGLFDQFDNDLDAMLRL